jgi:hypothetical protein
VHDVFTLFPHVTDGKPALRTGCIPQLAECAHPHEVTLGVLISGHASSLLTDVMQSAHLGSI